MMICVSGRQITVEAVVKTWQVKIVDWDRCICDVKDAESRHDVGVEYMPFSSRVAVLERSSMVFTSV